MKKTAFLLLLPLLACFVLLCGCVQEPVNPQLSDLAVPTGSAANTEGTTASAAGQDDAPRSEKALGKGVRKVYSFRTAFDPFAEEPAAEGPQELVRCEGGFLYTDENGKYGILSLDFQHDSGAVYAEALPKGSVFMVTRDDSAFEERAESLNRYALVSAAGEELLGAGYADFFVEGRFAVAMKAAEPAAKAAGALLTYSSTQFVPQEEASGTKERNVYYKGEWQIYDLPTLMPLPQAAGTAQAKWFANGELVGWTDEKGAQHITTALGFILPEGAETLESGDYFLLENTIATVYSANGEKRFSYDPQEYSLHYDAQLKYYCCAANKPNENRTYSFFFLDASGARIPGTYESNTPNVTYTAYGDYLFTSNRLYYGGRQITGERTALGGGLDDLFGRGAYLYAEGKNEAGVKSRFYTYYDPAGEALVEMEEPLAAPRINGFYIAGEDAENPQMYIFNTKKYVPAGKKLGELFAVVSGEDGNADLIDLFTGETLIPGYDAYLFAGTLPVGEDNAEEAAMIYAFSGDTVDVISVSAG